MNDKRGISLIEFIVVLAIAIIMSIISIPTFMSLYQNHRLTGTAEDLYYALQYARTEAIKRNTTVYVSFVTGDSWCYGIKAGSTCNCNVAGSCTLGTYSAASSGLLSLSSSGYSNNYVSFESTHGAANASGSLTFTIYNQSTLITNNIGVMGNITMCSTGISGYTAC